MIAMLGLLMILHGRSSCANRASALVAAAVGGVLDYRLFRYSENEKCAHGFNVP
jgi:hypothetical protein